MKVKILSVMTVLCLVFLGATLWRVDHFIQGDRQAWFESQMRSQSIAIEQTLLSELKNSEKYLVTSGILTTGLQQEPDWKNLSPYFAVVELQWQGAKNFSLLRSFAQSSGPAAQWGNDYFSGALSGLSASAVKGRRFYIKPFKDGAKNSWVAVIFMDGQRAVAAFAPGEIFQGLIDGQRSSVAKLQVMTEKGLAAIHPEPLYIGSLIDDTVFKNSLKSEGDEGFGEFQTGDGQKLYGAWSPISQTNLRVIARASVADLSSARWQILLQLGFLGFGLLAIAWAVLLSLVTRLQIENEKEIAQVRAATLAATPKAMPSVPVPVVSSSPSSASSVDAPTDSQKDKMAVYSRIASSLGHELKSPLLSILGFSQMIISKGESADVKESAESVIREAKRAKDVLDKLLVFAGENDKGEKKTEALISSPLLRALQACESLFQRKGVKVLKQIPQIEVRWSMDVDQLTKAFEGLLVNAVEALDRSPHAKEIQVALEMVGAQLKVRITDNGEGIAPENLTRVSDPFFTTRSFQNHMGLGMTHAAGVFREHGGAMTIQSELGKGTVVEVTINPPAEKVVVAQKVEELPKVISAPASVHAEVEQKILTSVKAEVPDLDMDVDQLLAHPVVEEVKSDDLTPALEEQAMQEMAVLPVDAMPFNDEKTPVDFIDKPNFEMPKKISKLDTVEFAIRKPGARERGLS